jgi:hypothetical protein
MGYRFNHISYWLGFIEIAIGGLLIGGISHGVFTPWVLLVAIPSVLTGFYLTVFKSNKNK